MKAWWFGLLMAGLTLVACQGGSEPDQERLETSEAGEALDLWYRMRMDREGRLDVGPWVAAFQGSTLRSDALADWHPLGPKNIGGRTLCIAFHPTDPNTIYAGSASGGLWVTSTGGKGAQAWHRIPINYPVLAVSSILIDPDNPERMWIGTGEMYNQQAASPGTISRYTRGTYGIGVLMTTDGGATWSPSLDWTSGDLRAIQKLAMNPLDPDVLYAATSVGLYRTDNAGEDWYQLLDQPMITDLWIHAEDTARIILAAGSYLTPGAGVYRSTDSGQSFSLISDLPSGYTGKAMLGGSPSDPEVIYCSLANANEGKGLYASTDAGQTWLLANSLDVPKYQGWYSHALAVSPDDPTYLLFGGIDMHRSSNAGSLLIQVSYWEEWLFGKVPAGGPEGPPYYVHADIHQIAWHPQLPGVAWVATDGGLFITEDKGLNFQGRNGGYQTQQFYARFSNSHQDAHFAIGGMQDNASAIYEGDDEWIRVIGGDGLSTAMDPTNDQRLFGSAQGLLLFRSLDRGQSFDPVSGSTFINESVPFNGAFQIDPKNPNRVYAGGQKLYRSSSFGALESWVALTPGNLDGNRLLTQIEISPANDLHLVVTTSSDPTFTNGVNSGKIRVSKTGGSTWTTATGVPNRYCTDIAFHPLGDTLLATFSGFSDNPLYRSINGGLTWSPFGAGLPPIPTNCVTYDPYESRHVYLGNDLGVFFSDDGGMNWTPFTTGLPEATIVMDLAISLPAYAIRAATHGHGVYESELVSKSVAIQPVTIPSSGVHVFPNPIQGRQIHIVTGLQNPGQLNARLIRISGEVVAQRSWPSAGESVDWLLPGGTGPGVYYLEVRLQDRVYTIPVLIDF